MVRPDEEGIASEEKYRILGYAKDRYSQILYFKIPPSSLVLRLLFLINAAYNLTASALTEFEISCINESLST